MAYDYSLLHIRTADGVLWATIDAPPINVMTVELFGELQAFTAEVVADDDIRAVVFESAHPEFFIAHFDVSAIMSRPRDTVAQRKTELKPFHQMVETWRTMPKVSMAKIAGRVGGGGAELSASLDMRFGVLGRTMLNQMEVPIGILPGGSATQRLPRLLGRGRAMEIILGGDDVDAATLDAWGWLNRAFPDVAALDAHVDELARRIASFPPQAVRNAKAAALAAEPDPVPGLLEEAYLFDELLTREDAHAAMGRFLAGGGQTREGELRVGALNADINR